MDDNTARDLVLMNIIALDNNSFPATWNRIFETAGFEVQALQPDLLISERGRLRFVLIQWPEISTRASSLYAHLKRTVKFGRLLVTCKRAGIPVVYLAHNALVHESGRRWLDAVTYRCVTRRSDFLLLFSPASRSTVVQARQSLGALPWGVVPHPAYEKIGAALDMQPTDDVAGSDQTSNLLHFGALRAYKGTEELLKAFARLNAPSAHLVLAGRVKNDQNGSRIRALAVNDPRVDLIDRRISDTELTALVSSADLVVLPYRRVLTSGSAIYALSHQTPVLVPDSPTFTELDQSTGTGNVIRYRGDLNPDDLLKGLARTQIRQPDMSARSVSACATALEAVAKRVQVNRKGRKYSQTRVVVFTDHEPVSLGGGSGEAWQLARAFVRLGHVVVYQEPASPDGPRRVRGRLISRWEGSDGIIVVQSQVLPVSWPGRVLSRYRIWKEVGGRESSSAIRITVGPCHAGKSLKEMSNPAEPRKCSCDGIDLEDRLVCSARPDSSERTLSDWESLARSMIA